MGSRRSFTTIFSSGDKSKNSFACFSSSFSFSKPRASKTSSGELMGVAPRRSSLFVPLELGEKIEPGTTNRSLLYSVVSLAVISVPDFSSASIIRVALEMPAISLLRIGKLHCVALKSGSNSEIKHPPFSTTSFINFTFVFGYIASSDRPDPGKTKVLSPTCIAFLWAMVSMPIAKPETITIGYPLSPAIIFSQASRP